MVTTTNDTFCGGGSSGAAVRLLRRNGGSSSNRNNCKHAAVPRNNKFSSIAVVVFVLLFFAGLLLVTTYQRGVVRSLYYYIPTTTTGGGATSVVLKKKKEQEQIQQRNNNNESKKSSSTRTTATRTKTIRSAKRGSKNQQHRNVIKNNNNAEDDDDRKKKKKPTFVLHVGLPKTGTSFLKKVLCGRSSSSSVTNSTATDTTDDSPDKSARAILRRDNFVGLGLLWGHFEGRNPDCLVYDGDGNGIADNSLFDPKSGRLSPSFVDRVRKLRRSGNASNAIFVHEGWWDNTPEQIRKLAKLLLKDWDVRVLIAYRPLYGWLPSLENQFQRMNPWAWPDNVAPGRGSRIKPWSFLRHPARRGLPFDLDDDRPLSSTIFQIVERYGKHPAEFARDKYVAAFGAQRVSIVPLHLLSSSSSPPFGGNHNHKDADGELLEYIFCKVLVDETPHTCRAVRGGDMIIGSGGDTGGDAVIVSNPSTNTDHFIIADRAYERNLVPKTSLRRKVVQAVEAYAKKSQEQQHQRLGAGGRRDDGWPRKCISNRTLNKLEEVSWQVELHLFDDYDDSTALPPGLVLPQGDDDDDGDGGGSISKSGSTTSRATLQGVVPRGKHHRVGDEGKKKDDDGGISSAPTTATGGAGATTTTTTATTNNNKNLAITARQAMMIHRDGFRDAVSRNKYCHLDVDLLLDDPLWIRFFQESYPQEKQEKNS